MEWERLITLNDVMKARLIKAKLDSFGIPTYISNENVSGLYGGSLSVDIYVQKAALKDAISLLEEVNEGTEEIHCPNCNSTHIREVRVTRVSDNTYSHAPEEFMNDNAQSYLRLECENCGEVWTLD